MADALRGDEAGASLLKLTLVLFSSFCFSYYISHHMHGTVKAAKTFKHFSKSSLFKLVNGGDESMVGPTFLHTFYPGAVWISHITFPVGRCNPAAFGDLKHSPSRKRE